MNTTLVKLKDIERFKEIETNIENNSKNNNDNDNSEEKNKTFQLN